MATPKSNFAAAYSLYVEGKSLPEIARILGEPYEKLANVAQRENWPVLAMKLRDCLPAVVPDDPNRSLPVIQSEKAKLNMERIQANRERVYAVTQAMLDDAQDVLQRLHNKTLKMRRYWNNKGIITHVDADPSLQDRVALATYVQTIANMSYQALGDRQAGEKEIKELGPGAAQSVPQITVYLPGIVQQKTEKNVTPAEKVIDVPTEPGESV